MYCSHRLWDPEGGVGPVELPVSEGFASMWSEPGCAVRGASDRRDESRKPNQPIPYPPMDVNNLCGYSTIVFPFPRLRLIVCVSERPGAKAISEQGWSPTPNVCLHCKDVIENTPTFDKGSVRLAILASSNSVFFHTLRARSPQE